MDWKIWNYVLGITLILSVLRDSVIVKGSVLYVSNGTGIIKFDTDSKDTQLVVSQLKGRIVGVAIDIADSLLFWSDVSSEYRAIYRSALDGTSPQIIVQDVLQCNGLTTDWISNHIYWTDAESQTVEIANYDGSGRRVMFSLSGRYLAEPRGIVVDPIYGYLFWASQMGDNAESRKTDTARDQDTNGQIERSRLDGSDHQVIVNTKVFWPNQLTISRLFGKLYWVEASPTSGIMSCKFDGSSYKKERDLFGISSGNPSFGLAITGNKVIVSTWLTNALYSTLVETSNSIWIKETEKLGTEELFSMVIGDVSSQESKSGDHPCGREDKGGCSHLCLPSGWGNDYTCVCPSYSGLTIGQDGKTCTDIKDVLLFTSQGSGEVNLISISESTTALSTNLVGRSDTPASIVYEPENKVMIWSDTDQRTIYKTKLGKKTEFKEVFMNNDDGIGIIEDMAIDIFGGGLYFINSGVIFGSLDPMSKWYRIEMVSLDRMVRRTLVTSVDQLTSIALDTNKGILYFGSCGRQSKIYSTLFDGSEIQPIESNFSLTCLTDLTYRNGHLYMVDKADDEQENEMNHIMSYNTDDNTWNILTKIKQVPNHMAVTNTHLYYCLYTDEGQGQIVSFDLESHEKRVFFTALYKISGLFYSSSVPIVPSEMNPCQDSPCSDGCTRVISPTSEDGPQYRCTCPDAAVSMLSADRVQCVGPENFIFFADLNTIKQISLDTDTEDRVQTVYYAPSQSNIHSLYYEDVTDTLYWTDQTRSSILSMTMTPGEMTPNEIYNGGNMLVLGLTLDVEKQKLFWAAVDSDRQGYIMRLKLTHSHKAKRIIFTDAVPRCVILSPDDRWLFWTEYNDNDGQGGDNSRPSVHKAHQNGNHHEIILEEKLTWPNSLTFYENRLYIADGIGKIWSMNQDGSDVKELYFLTGSISHVFDVKITNNVIFYSDWSTHTVNMVDMVTGQQDILASNLTRPTSLVVYQGSSKEDWNLCNTDVNRCSHSCVPVPKSVHCSCPEGHYLQSDRITCIKGESPWIHTRSSHCSTDCSQNAQCSQLLSTFNFQCVCLPGYHGNGTFCEACPVDFYKQHLDNTTCLPCPVSMATNGKTASSNCSCRSTNAVVINDTCTDVTMETTEVTPVETPVVKVQVLATEKSIESVKLHVQSTHTSMKDEQNNEILNDRKWREPTDVEYNVPPQNGNGMRPYFDSCPHGETITLYIPAFKNKVTLNVTWHAHDITGQKLQIKSNFVITNGIITFEWWANGEEGKQRVMMEATDRWGHTVTCQFYVKVLDLEPPIFTYCPHDISIKSNKGVERVLWSKPEVIDNVKVGTFTGSHNAGDEFVEGVTMVNYTAADQAGNYAYCNFSVNLHKVDNSCDLPNIKNGEFSCTPIDLGDGKIEERCEILCNKGFVVNPLSYFSDVYKCAKEKKELQHLQNLMSTLQPCLKYKVPSIVTQEFRIWFEGPCLADNLQLKMDLSSAVVEHIEVREFCPKSKCIYSNITIDCDTERSDSISKRSTSAERSDSINKRSTSAERSDSINKRSTSAERSDSINKRSTSAKRSDSINKRSTSAKRSDSINKRSTSAERSDSINKRSTSAENTVFLIRWNITIDNSTGFSKGQVENILMTIRLELMKHLPGLNLRINGHDYATVGELKMSNLILGCQVGEVLHKLGCVSCPPGTKYATLTETCEICNNGSYQPYDGQTDCLPCESDQTSQQGAISQEQCITVSSLNEMSKFLIITACTFGFVFLCMAIFMYMQFKRQQKRTRKRMSPSNGHKYITPNIYVASSTLPKASPKMQKSDFKVEGRNCHLYGNHDYEEPGYSYNTNLSTRTTLSGRTVYQNDLSHAPSPAGSPRSLRSTHRSLGSPVSERSFYTGDFRNFSPTLKSNTLQSQNRRPNLLLYDK